MERKQTLIFFCVFEFTLPEPSNEGPPTLLIRIIKVVESGERAPSLHNCKLHKNDLKSCSVHF